MDNDPVRERVRDGLHRCGLTLREASLALGRNVVYLHQFLNRGSPRALAYREVVKLAELLGCDPETLRHEGDARPEDLRIVSGDHPPRLRLLSANPAYPAYICRTEEAHVVGKALWTVRKV